jgi:hypothetical protein
MSALFSGPVNSSATVAELAGRAVETGMDCADYNSLSTDNHRDVRAEPYSCHSLFAQIAAKTRIEIKGWHRLRHALHDAAALEQQQPQSSARPAAACLVRNHDERLRRSNVGREAQRPSWSDPAI